jgi:hypothetical protein
VGIHGVLQEKIEVTGIPKDGDGAVCDLINQKLLGTELKLNELKLAHILAI